MRAEGSAKIRENVGENVGMSYDITDVGRIMCGAFYLRWRDAMPRGLSAPLQRG